MPWPAERWSSPSRMVLINPVESTSSKLVLDIGGGSVRLAVVDCDLHIERRAIAPLPDRGAPDALKKAICRLIRELEAVSPLPGGTAGVAIPGIWDRQTGIMKKAVNLPALEGANVPELFSRVFGRPVSIDSDVNCAALAQWSARRPPPPRFLYLSLGTGVGGAVIIDGQPLRHTNGGAGHFGFMLVSPDSATSQDPIASAGILQDFASGPAIAAASAVEFKLAPGEKLTRSGPVALTRAAAALALGIASLVSIYLPETVAIGGGVLDHNPQLLALTREQFARVRSPLLPPKLPIEAGPLPSHDAGVIGAAILARL